eukprot:SAG31_NODE_43052_length_268_cov_10.183432_1_plen_60_part_01
MYRYKKCTTAITNPLQHLPALIPDFNTTVAETHIFTVCITAPNDSYGYHPGLTRIVTLEL